MIKNIIVENKYSNKINDFIKSLKNWEGKYTDPEFDIEIITKGIYKNLNIMHLTEVNPNLLLNQKSIKIKNFIFTKLKNIYELFCNSNMLYIFNNLVEDINLNYSIWWLNINGILKFITLDNYLFINKENNDWSIDLKEYYLYYIFEKAFAKIFYQYNNLEKLSYFQILNMIITIPINQYEINLKNIKKLEHLKSHFYYLLVLKELDENDKNNLFEINSSDILETKDGEKYNIVEIIDSKDSSNNLVKAFKSSDLSNKIDNSEGKIIFDINELHKYFDKIITFKRPKINKKSEYLNGLEILESNETIVKLFIKEYTKIEWVITQFNKIFYDKKLSFNQFRIYLFKEDYDKKQLINDFHYYNYKELFSIKFELEKGNYFLWIETADKNMFIKDYTINTICNKIIYLERIYDIDEFSNLKILFYKNFINNNDRFVTDCDIYNINTYKIYKKKIINENFIKKYNCKIWIFENKSNIDLNIKIKLSFKDEDEHKFYFWVVKNLNFNYYIENYENFDISRIENIIVVDILPIHIDESGINRFIDLIETKKNFLKEITYIKNYNCICDCSIF